MKGEIKSAVAFVIFIYGLAVTALILGIPKMVTGIVTHTTTIYATTTLTETIAAAETLATTKIITTTATHLAGATTVTRTVTRRKYRIPIVQIFHKGEWRR